MSLLFPVPRPPSFLLLFHVFCNPVLHPEEIAFIDLSRIEEPGCSCGPCTATCGHRWGSAAPWITACLLVRVLYPAPDPPCSEGRRYRSPPASQGTNEIIPFPFLCMCARFHSLSLKLSVERVANPLYFYTLLNQIIYSYVCFSHRKPFQVNVCPPPPPTHAPSHSVFSCRFTICHKTEVVKNTLNPVWQAFKIPVRALCNGDYDR